MVVFTYAAEDDINTHMDDQFFTFRVKNAENAKDARRKAWRTAHKRKGLRFIQRERWRVFGVARAEEVKAAGPWRAAGISI